jgi:hypothetical protein
MPVFQFKNINTNEVRDVYIPITGDVLFYNGEPGETFISGSWKRDYTNYGVNIGIDTKTDPFSKSDFVNATNKKMTIGEMMDLSKELSEQRAAKNGGIDPVKQKYYDDYRKKTGGNPHVEEQKEKARKKGKEQLEKLGWDIEVKD